MRADIFTKLRGRLASLEERLGERSWTDIVKDEGGEKIAAIAYATATYGIYCDQSYEWEQEAEKAWGAIDSNWKYWVNELYT